jgi:pimeloyl-ACP methyl ester carboxylesterase
VSSAPDLEVVERHPAGDTGTPPLVLVHGLGHGAWCWELWQEAAAAAGHSSYAVSLRGHGGSGGRLRTRWREPLKTLLDWLPAAR